MCKCRNLLLWRNNAVSKVSSSKVFTQSIRESSLSVVRLLFHNQPDVRVYYETQKKVRETNNRLKSISTNILTSGVKERSVVGLDYEIQNVWEMTYQERRPGECCTMKWRSLDRPLRDSTTELREGNPSRVRENSQVD